MNSSLDQEVLFKLNEHSLKLEQIYQSVEKTRKYFLWTLVTSIVMLLLPLVGIAIAVPMLINSLKALPLGL